MTTDRIETELVEIESTVARLRAAQAQLLRIIDRRQVPLADACRSLHEWIAARLDVAPETARLLARTARTDSASVLEALAAGTVTFDRASELIRLAAVDSDDDLIDRTRIWDISGLRRRVAHHRRVTPHHEIEAFEDRHLVMQPSLDESAWRLWGSLPGIEGALVDQALTARADQFPTLPDGTRPTVSQRRADALVALCTDSSAGDEGTVATPSVTVFVDARTAAETNGETGVTIHNGPRVGPRALEAILCHGVTEVTAIADDGKVLGIGDRSPVIPPRIRRYVFARDQICTADGCRSRYRLQPHHIDRRASGADNDPENLTLLCWFHHHVVVHGMGYRIDPDSSPQRRRFLAPTGSGPP